MFCIITAILWASKINMTHIITHFCFSLSIQVCKVHYSNHICHSYSFLLAHELTFRNEKECLVECKCEYKTRRLSGAVDLLHQDIGPCVGKPQSYQTSTHQHRGCQQDRDGFSNTDQGAKDQVPQHCCQLTQGVTEAEASPSERKKESKAMHSSLFLHNSMR